MQNLREALARVIDRHSKAVRTAARKLFSQDDDTGSASEECDASDQSESNDSATESITLSQASQIDARDTSK